VTTIAPETLAHQDAGLLQRLHSVLGDHPAGPALHLLLAPEGLNIGADEILVQRLDAARNVIELHPCKISDLTLTDVPHLSQVVPLSDGDFARYTQSPGATDYVKDGDGNAMVPCAS
jgi:hypothetical protein